MYKIVEHEHCDGSRYYINVKLKTFCKIFIIMVYNIMKKFILYQKNHLSLFNNIHIGLAPSLSSMFYIIVECLITSDGWIKIDLKQEG